MRRYDQHGLVVQRGRSRVRPFGRIGEWPERQAGLDAMAADEEAAQQRRAEYRQREQAQPCGGCGHPAPGHDDHCIWHGHIG